MPDTAFAPLRSLNLDAPKQLLRSGELSEAMNIDFASHGGAPGRRKLFGPLVSQTVTRPYNIVEWSDEPGSTYVAWQEDQNIKYFKLIAGAGGAIQNVELTGLQDQPGGMFVLGNTLYYGDIDNQLILRLDSLGGGGASIKQYTGWGITAPTVAPVLSDGAFAALRTGYYRYFYTLYDAFRNVESRRSPFSLIKILGAVGSIISTFAPTNTRSATHAKLYRVYASALPEAGINEACYLIGINAICVGIIPLGGGITFDDTFWGNNGASASYRNDSFDVPNCRLAFTYGNHIHMLGAGDLEGSLMTSLAGKPVQIAAPYASTNEGCGTSPKAWFPTSNVSYTIANMALNVTAVTGFQASKLLFTENNIYRISGAADAPVPLQIVEGHGVAGIWSMAHTPYGLIFYDGADLVRFSGASIEPFKTDGIQSILQGIFATQRRFVAIGYSSTMRQLLVAFADTVTEGGPFYWVLCYDFQRGIWTRWRTHFRIYCMREFNRHGARILVVWTNSGLQYYPANSGEVFPGGSKFSVIYGTETLNKEKVLKNLTLTFGNWGTGRCKLKLHHSGETEVGGQFSSQEKDFDAVPNATRTIGDVSFGQVRGRFLELEIVGNEEGDSQDWYLHSVDVVDLIPAEINP